MKKIDEILYNPRKKINKKVITICIYITIFAIMIPIMIISKYNHPSADDYGYSDTTYKAIVEGENIFQVLKVAVIASIDGIKVWQGLYSSGFLLALQPAIFGESVYMLVPYIIILLLFGGIGSFLKTIIKYILKSDSKIWTILTTILVFFIVQTLPSPVEGLFWFNGAINYLFFLACIFFYTSLMIKYFYMEKGKINTRKVVNIVLSLMCAFIMSGGNHVTAFIALLVSGGFVIYSIYKKEYKKAIVYCTFLAVGIIGLIINLTSPGTEIRASAIEYEGSIFKTIYEAAYEIFNYINNWCNFSLITYLIIITPFIYKLVSNKENKENFKLIYSIIYMILSYGILCAMICVPYYAMGSFGGGRLTNTIYIMFVVLVTINYIYLLAVISKYIKNKECLEKMEKTRTSILCIVIVFGFINIAVYGNGDDYGTSLEAIVELISGEAQEYSRQLNERLEFYLDNNIKEVEVNALTVHPKLLYLSDISEDSNDWKNAEVSIYYDKNSVSVKSNSEE